MKGGGMNCEEITVQKQQFKDIRRDENSDRKNQYFALVQYPEFTAQYPDIKNLKRKKRLKLSNLGAHCREI